MLQKLFKKLTNGYQEVPLFYTTFNLKEYLSNGKKGSCLTKIHPSLKDDKYVKEQINSIIDHIRDNYDMENLTK